MPSEPTTYAGYRFPAEVIHHATWLYHLFSLSLRDIELILAEQGVVVSHESIRRWCLRFGAEFAAKLRKRGGRGRVIPGTWMGFTCGSTASCSISGVLWTRTVSCSISWSKSGETPWPRSASSSIC